jgi:hypothetical protein
MVRKDRRLCRGVAVKYRENCGAKKNCHREINIEVGRGVRSRERGKAEAIKSRQSQPQVDGQIWSHASGAR